MKNESHITLPGHDRGILPDNWLVTNVCPKSLLDRMHSCDYYLNHRTTGAKMVQWLSPGQNVMFLSQNVMYITWLRHFKLY